MVVDLVLTVVPRLSLVRGLRYSIPVGRYDYRHDFHCGGFSREPGKIYEPSLDHALAYCRLDTRVKYGVKYFFHRSFREHIPVLCGLLPNISGVIAFVRSFGLL